MRMIVFAVAIIAIAGSMAACGAHTNGVYGYAGNGGYGVGASSRIPRHKCYDCIQYRQDGNPSQ